MRPDVNSWRNTGTMHAVAFSPKRLLAGRVPAWMMFAGCVQGGASLASWWALTLIPRADDTPAHDNAALAWAAGIRDVVLGSPLLLFVLAQFAGLAFVALVVGPLVRRSLRRHAKGLRDLFDAIQGLASGATPKPLAAGLPGETGYLSVAFNDMAARLAASRRELVAANEMLEQRVEERTRELREACSKMEEMAATDALSGLANRRCMREQLPRMFEEAEERGDDIVFVAIDLDGFKGVNDALGHQVGDQVIRVAAEVLRSTCRDRDLTARLGGDEFLVVLRGATPREAAAVAERIQQEFQRRMATLLQESRVAQLPSMSMGISSLRTGAPASVEELLVQADGALYAAKQHGKHRAEVFARGAA